MISETKWKRIGGSKSVLGCYSLPRLLCWALRGVSALLLVQSLTLKDCRDSPTNRNTYWESFASVFAFSLEGRRAYRVRKRMRIYKTLCATDKSPLFAHLIVNLDVRYCTIRHVLMFRYHRRI
jgi:hypothetical protein